MGNGRGRTYSRWPMSKWDSDEYLDLTPPAQHLYGVLFHDPQISHCGRVDWRPPRLSERSRNWDVNTIHYAAAELECSRFVLFDPGTEEALVCDHIFDDELLRNPKMAVAVVAAYAAVASRDLRAAVVTELRRCRDLQADFSSWTSPYSREDLARLLDRAGLDARPYSPSYAYVSAENTNAGRSGNPTENGTGLPIELPFQTLVQIGNPGGFGSAIPIGAEPTCTLHPAPSPDNQGGGHPPAVGHPRALPQATPAPVYDDPPPHRCPEHLHAATSAPCRACGDARRAADAWNRRNPEAARQFVAFERDLIRQQCTYCDEVGWRIQPPEIDDNLPVVRCDHAPWSEDQWLEYFIDIKAKEIKK